MTPERFRLISELYDAAASLNPQERTRFIDERCANDDELRRELMDAFRDAGSALAGVVERAAAAVVDGRDHRLGRRLGKYHILRVLGEAVWVWFTRRNRIITASRGVEGHQGRRGIQLLLHLNEESQILARLSIPGSHRFMRRCSGQTLGRSRISRWSSSTECRCGITPSLRNSISGSGWN
jgi:hypothetical protein